ncbi:YDG/SRA domain-containing protein [Nocardioides nematodiphilus]|uniref:YDG/SRA domain-containing protein n=1 Tax=Nocardioides nematodiphilus TaxID=2849669 RepID=UPI001CD9F2F6|nr:YDG/SRA domain-containing protein [Nocardioides nematodiphilus]MCA1981397.1 HNH endonuclease [Nocardioides nematodiphilus]
MPGYFFGEVAGYPVGAEFADRKEAMLAGLHDNWVPGISGRPNIGADCIAVNRGYVDDEDHGDWLLYTGAGGNDPSTKRQISDQDIQHRHNAALVYSEENGLPVRVLRGPRGEKPFAPKIGYRYDGLYKVIRHWSETGRDGFRIWRFHLVRLAPDEARPWTPDDQTPAAVPAWRTPRFDFADTEIAYEPPNGAPAGNAEPERATGIVQRIVRSSKVSQHVKELYNHTCQICGIKLDLPVGSYSEGAHIRGLGAPHDGPDTVGNVLCLCPNHHVLFDKGGIFLSDELVVYDHTGNSRGRLEVHASHAINIECVRHHRTHHGY